MATYNFYISQMRTRIEMAFGQLTTKWRILNSPLNIKIRNIGKIFLSLIRLHNHCINERLKEHYNKNNDTTTFRDDDYETC
jgi:DDE superfamily endonuclease